MSGFGNFNKIGLGDVMAKTSVGKLNGRDLGVAWTRPFRLDATAALEDGDNELEVTVVNSWYNRVKGDQLQKRSGRRVCPTGNGEGVGAERTCQPGKPGRERTRILPDTSTTLLRDLASGSDHARWADFVARYRPMMESFMQRRFPDLEPEDAIQETLLALVGALPTYRYVPGETGHFHNYLTGILWHKALNMRRAKLRSEGLHERYREDMATARGDAGHDAVDEAHERRSVILEIALQQLLVDDSILERNRLIFRRVAMDGERPDAVAEAFGVTRAVVDQTKKRLTDRLRALVKALEQADG